MSQQTQPQQKQVENQRRGITSGIANIISRGSSQSHSNSPPINFEKSNNNEGNDFEFFETNYETRKVEKGCVYTWGSGEMGQLGYNIKIISKMPKDREGYPYQPQPFKIESLKDQIVQISAGDGHTVAIDVKGRVYSWGASACGQLGLSSMKDLPTDIEGYPYQPTPRMVDLLSDVKIIQISCGDAHTVALSSDGKLYSWGGGGCGQLGHPDTQAMPKDEDGCPYQPKPKLISALRTMTVKQIACGKAHTVSVLENGHLYSWGAGACGQLGHPDTSSFPSDEDGYPFQPIPRCVYALKNLTLVYASCGDVHTMVLTNKGEIYCFGGGSCGQLGLGNISQLPLDVDSCPFMPVPQKIDSLTKEVIIKLSCGDSHSMALTKEGIVYAWGEATCGQLGFEDLKNLPRNADGRVYQPVPQKVTALEKKRIIEISCGEAHSLVLTDRGHVFAMGANSCGQLGQHYIEMKQSDAEEIFMNKPSDMTGQSFGTYLETSSLHSLENDNSADSKIEDGHSELDELDHTIAEEDPLKVLEGNVQTGSIPHLNIFEEKQKESVSLIPKLIKSLMHLRVNKISSGGVHNICIVEPYPNHLNSDLYKCFMKNKFTDVCFVFKEKCYSIKDPILDLEKLNEGEEIKECNSNSIKNKNKLRKGIYERKICAHKFVLAAKSPVFEEMFSKSLSKFSPDKKEDSRLSPEQGIDLITIKECNFKAFKLILDFIYLENLDILDDICGGNELTEILKLAKQYQLPELQEKCENQLLSLPSIQLFRNLITNSSQINSFLKRNKDKKNIAGRNYHVEGETEISKSTILDSFEPTTMSSVSQDSEAPQRRNAYSKKIIKQKNDNLDGIMFLADGRILVVNNELYQEIMKKGIIIDLNDKNKLKLDQDIKDTFSSNEEESKEHIRTHAKSENPRNVTQSKKFKKSVTTTSNISTHAKKSITNVESSVEGSDQSKVYLPILKRCKLRMFESKDSSESSPKSSLKDNSYSDIVISIDGKEIFAHRAVLCSRSTYFEAMFSHDFKETDKTKIVLKNVASFELFCNLLEYMYSDDKPINIKNVFEMLNLADEYGVTSFKEKSEIMLSKYITISTVCVIFKYANELNCERLKETCMIYMKENYDEVIYSSGFEELDKDEMLKIIRLGKDK